MTLFESVNSHPPVARRGDHVDRIHGVDVADPYRWLEDVDSLGIKAWTKAQNAHTQTVLSGVAFGKKLRERVEELSTFETMGIPVEANGRLFYTNQGAHARQPSLFWRVEGEDEQHCLLNPV